MCVCVLASGGKELVFEMECGTDEGVKEKGRHAQEGKQVDGAWSPRCVCLCGDVYVRLVMSTVYVCVCVYRYRKG